jgi:hypothetical protein
MSSVAERNQRLDQLVQAATQWANSRTSYLNNNVNTLKAILQGRGGANGLAQAGVNATSGLVVSQIDDFLVGS